jgi:hypothetical protein
MIKLQGILAVILFWVVTIMLSPIIILFGVIFVVGITAIVISGLVYDITTSYLKEKRQ